MVRIPAFCGRYRIIRNIIADDNASLCSCIVCDVGLIYSVDCGKCILLGRAEAFAAKNGPVASFVRRFWAWGLGLL